MVLTSPAQMDNLPQTFQAELDFFRFPIIDPALPVAEVFSAYGYIVPRNTDNLPQTLALLQYLSSVEGQTLLAQHSRGAITYAPANGGVKEDLLSPEAQRGMALLADADLFAPEYMLSIPNRMWSKINYGMAKFYRDDGGVDDFVIAMEEARQGAEEKGLFAPLQN